MSHRNFGIPILFDPPAPRLFDPYEETRREWRRGFWNFVAIVIVALALSVSSVTGIDRLIQP